MFDKALSVWKNIPHIIHVLEGFARNQVLQVALIDIFVFRGPSVAGAMAKCEKRRAAAEYNA